MRQFEKSLASLFIAASVMASGAIAFSLTKPDAGDQTNRLLSTFASERAMTRFVEESMQNQKYSYGIGEQPMLMTPESPSSDSEASHSGTNVQVAGVDELDTVKTDGQYIYIANSTGVSIVRAYPPELLSNVTFIDKSYLGSFVNDTMSAYFTGIFVLPGKLITVAYVQDTSHWNTYLVKAAYSAWVPTEQWTIVSVFDIEDPAHPTLIYTAGVTGWSSTGRLIGDTVYLVSQTAICIRNNETLAPRVLDGPIAKDLPLDKIHYDPEMRDASSFTSILAVDTGSRTENCISIITGYSSILYMSTASIFLTVQRWTGAMVMLDSTWAAPEDNLGSTTIYKIAFTGLSMAPVASADVKGWVHDQFSLDEKDSYLRVATTTSWVNRSNAVFILDKNLRLIGSLDGIAKGESIFSARFVDDALYLVTFRSMDPLFVIDLSIPSLPRVVGALTMPGFSDYLHPLDRDHILGIGSLNGSAKISIYDVSDPVNPVETAQWTLEGYGSSHAIYDHKEVLYDAGMGLLVVPISGYNWSFDGSSRYVNGEFVFNVSASGEIELRGSVALEQSTNYYYGIRRALYIEDCLYTISSSTIRVSRLSDLTQIASLVYDDSSSYYWRAMVG
jgi:inhibitor of cysteine peptidase